jgi:hypothetical protein
MRNSMLLPVALLGLAGCAVPVDVPAGSQVTAASISPAPAGSLTPTVSASYVAPATTYVTPATTYVTPSSTTYVTPSTTYVAPSTGYVTSAPTTTYVTPAQTTTTYVATVPNTTQYVVPAVVGAEIPPHSSGHD